MFAIRQRLENYLQTWFKRRAPISRDITLNLRNVYIFLSKERLLYAFLLIITFVAGINYANNLVLGLCFLLGSLLVVTIHYTFAQLAGLQIKLVDISDTQGLITFSETPEYTGIWDYRAWFSQVCAPYNTQLRRLSS